MVDGFEPARAHAPAGRRGLDHLPAALGGGLLHEGEALLRREVQHHRLHLRIGRLLGLRGPAEAPRAARARRAGRAPVASARRRRVGDVGADVVQARQAERLNGQESRIRGQQDRQHQARDGLAEPRPPLVPDRHERDEGQHCADGCEQQPKAEHRQSRRRIDSPQPRQGDGDRHHRQREQPQPAAPKGGKRGRTFDDEATHAFRSTNLRAASPLGCDHVPGSR